MDMKRLLTHILTILIFASIVLAEDKVKVGVTLPLSGPIAEFGQAVTNAIKLAQKENPELFQQIEFIFEDDAYESKKSILNLRKFQSIDQIDLLFSWGAEPSLSIAPLAEKNKIPLITQSPLTSISKDRDYVIRLNYNDDKHGRILTEYLQQQGVKKIAMIMSELSFFELLSKGIKQHLKVDQSFDIVSVVLPSEKDFKSVLIKNSLQDYDIVGVYLLPDQLRLFYRQAKQLGLSFKTFGTTTFESTSVLSDVMSLVENVPYTHSATTDQFLNSYQKEFGNNMHIGYAAGCYDFAIMLGKLVTQGIIKAGDQPEAIIAAFNQVKPFSGAAGKVSLVKSKEYGTYFDYAVSVKKLEAGKIKTIFTID